MFYNKEEVTRGDLKCASLTFGRPGIAAFHSNPERATPLLSTLPGAHLNHTKADAPNFSGLISSSSPQHTSFPTVPQTPLCSGLGVSTVCWSVFPACSSQWVAGPSAPNVSPVTPTTPASPPGPQVLQPFSVAHGSHLCLTIYHLSKLLEAGTISFTGAANGPVKAGGSGTAECTALSSRVVTHMLARKREAAFKFTLATTKCARFTESSGAR